MSIRKSVSAVLTLGILLTAAISMLATASQAEKSEIAIKVNGETVKKSELQQQIDRTFQQMKKQYGHQLNNQEATNKLRSRVKEQIVQKRVDQLVLKTNARQSDVSVSKQEVDKQFQSVKKRFENEDQLRKVLEQRGMSMENFRSRIEDKILVQKFIDQNIGNVSISEQDARQYYEKNKKRFQGQPFDQIKGKIMKSLSQMKKRKQRQELVNDLRKKSDIEVRV